MRARNVAGIFMRRTRSRHGPGGGEPARVGLGRKRLLPCIALSEDVFGKALRAIPAVGLLDDFEHQFCHTHMIRHGFSRAWSINPRKSEWLTRQWFRVCAPRFR